MTSLLLDPAAAPFIAAAVGLCVGSFLNVVIHRLPKMLEQGWQDECAGLRGETPPERPRYNIMVPRSRCPSCGHRITALENIPVLSWLVLRGKCSACGVAISARYPLVEILGGALAACAVWRFGPTWEALAACGFLWTLLALTFIDFDTQLLPDDITLPLLWAGLGVNLFGVFVPLRDAVIGAMAGYLALWTVYWLFKLIRGKEGMGYGDFKLLAALGAWLGWQLLPLIVLMSSIVGAVIGITLVVFKGRDHNIPLAFGPYLAIAGAIALFFGPNADADLLSGMNAPLVIGLTGGIGSGKSEVTRAFAARGVEFADADLAAHALTARGAPGFAGVVAEFGPQTVDAAGELDRTWLRRRVFADADARARLEAILHPLIHAYLERAVAAWTGAYGLLSVPLLLERGGLLSGVARILVVDCPEEEQVRRVAERNGMPPAEVRAVMATQMARAARLARADDVIDNSGTIADIAPQVARLDAMYRELAARRQAGARTNA